MKIKVEQVINVGIVYNVFDTTDVKRDVIVYRKNTKLRTYLRDLPTDCDWLIGLNGNPVDLAKDGDIRLKANDTLQLVVVPHGGDSFKSILRIAAIVAIAVVAHVLTAGMSTLAAVAVTAAVTAGGALLMNAVLPPATPKSDKEDSQSYGYDGAKNTSKQGIAMPVVYGLYRVAGNYIDAYTDNIGDDQYLYGRTVLSEGTIDSVTLPLLNDQPIENYTNVEWGARMGATTETVNPWFNRSNTQINKSTKLTSAWTTHTTTTPVDQLQLNLQFTRGLVHMTDKGKKQNRTATFEIQYSEAGANNWRAFGSNYQIDTLGVLSGATPSTTKLAVSVKPTLTDTTKAVPYSFNIEYRKSGTSAWTTYKTVSGFSSNISYTNNVTNWGDINNGQVTYNYQANATSYEFAVPQGAYEMRITGQGTMTAWGYIVNQGGSATRSFTDNRAKVLRKTVESGKLDLGTYDVRIRKSSAEGDNEYDLDEAYLTDVGEIVTTGITLSNIANAYYKIKMNEQLNGVPNITWLVRGVKVNKYDINGNVTANEWSDNPAWIILDMLIGKERGSPDIYKVDFPMFVEWAAYCETAGLKFNGTFDTTSTLWDACMDVLKIGHAAFSRIGTKLSLTIDRPQDPVMLFGPGNIFKDSFKVNYLPLTGRANEFELSYFDKTSNNEQKTIRIIDPEADNRGDLPRPVAISMVGIDNFDQAQKEAWYQLYNNRYIRRTIVFDAPIESIGLGIGEVALIQHDMMNWGTSGRVGAGSTSTVINIDKMMDMETGNDYSMLVVHDKLKLSGGTISSINGKTLYVTGINAAAKDALRIIQPSTGRDTEILDFLATSDTTAYVTVDNISTFAATKAVEFYNTDVIEERDVVFNDTPSGIITLKSAFSQVPAQYVNYMVGVKTIVKKPYRLKSINGNGFDKRTLTWIEYNDAIYNPPEVIVPLPPTTMPKGVNHVSDLQYVYDPRATDANTTVRGVVSWNVTDTSNYGGADIYVALNGGGYVFNKTALNTSEAQLDFQFADTVSIKVVAFNTTLVRAPIATAPSIDVTVAAGPTRLDAPTNLNVTLVSYLALGVVEATWSAPASVAGLPVKYRVQVKQNSATVWDEYGVTSEVLLRIGDLTAATYSIRVRTERAEAYSAWANGVFQVGKTSDTIAPGADVTGNNTAKDVANVGGRTVADVLKKLDDAFAAASAGQTDNTPPSAPTNLAAASAISDQGVDLTYTWTASTSTDVAGYSLAVKQGVNGNYIEFLTSNPTYKLSAQARNTTYVAKVRAYDKAGNYSAYTGEVSHTTAKDTTPPGPVTNVSVDKAFTTAFVQFQTPFDNDYAYTTVNLLNSGNSLVQSLTVTGGRNSLVKATISNLTKGATYSVNLFNYDTSGNTSTVVNSGTFTMAGGIDIGDFTPGLSPTATVATLPSPTNYTGAKLVFNQADSKLYSYVNGAWIAAVAQATGDVQLQPNSVKTEMLVDAAVIASKIKDASIEAAKIKDGAVNANKLNVTMGGNNLLRNSSFENTVYGPNGTRLGAGFSVYNNPRSDGTTYDPVTYDVQNVGRNGGYCQLVQWTGAQLSTKGIYLDNVAGINNSGIMQPNRTYIISWWAKGSGGAATAGVSLRWNVTPSFTALSYPTLTGSWQRYAFKLVWGSSVDTSAYITTDYTGTSAGFYYIDDIQIEEGDVLTAYSPALLSGEVTGQLVSDAAISTAKLSDNAVTASKILAGSIQAGHIAANSVQANKLVATSRPFSIVGANFRIDTDGVMRWDACTAYYQKSNGTQASRAIAAGGAGPAGVYRLYFYIGDDGTNTNLDARPNNQLDLEGNDNYKLVALWKGGTDLIVAAGVGTIINGGQIVTGSIKADQIAANTIATKNLLIADSLNYAENPDFSMGKVGYDFSANTANIINDSGKAYRGSYCAQVTSFGTLRNFAFMRVQAGDQLYGYAWINQTGINSNGNGQSYARITGYDANNNENWNGNGTQVAGGTSHYGAAWYQLSEVNVTVPPTVERVRIEVVHYTGNGETFVGMMGMMRKSGGNLIVDGAITANKIAANSISADKIQANSITGGKLSINSRPISVAGVNIRYDNDGVVRWDNGSIQYQMEDGAWVTRAINSGFCQWGGWNQPVNICYNATTNSANLGVFYNQDVTSGAYGQQIPIATWNSGTKDFVVKAGTSTIISGANIVTGSINANKIQGKTITADQILGSSITANEIAVGTITAAQIATGALTARVLAVGNGDNIVPDSGMNDAYWWNSNVPDGRLATQAVAFGLFNRALAITPNGGIDVFSPFFNVDAGATYKITMGVNGSNIDSFQPLIHMPGIQWYSMIDGRGVDPSNPSIKLSGTFSNNYETYMTIPLGDNNFNRWQFRLMGSWTGTILFAVKIVRVSDTTLIKDGAITTDKITVNSLRGDRIQTGTLSADKLDANSVLAGTIKVGTSTLNDIAAQAQNGTPLTWVQYQGIYTINGNYITKTGGGDQWDYNAIVEEPLRNTFILTGKFPSQGTFFGVRQARDASTYGGLDYAWHRSSNGNWYIFESGNAIFADTQGAGVTFNDNTIFKIEHVGNVVNYWADSGLIRSRPANPNLTWWAQVDIAPPGASVRLLSWGQTSDNSLINTDPAARINQYSSVIDPGKILISGGTTLSNWRAGGDNTKIEGGNIYANSIKANSLSVGNRGIGFIGLNFEWNPSNNWVYWSEGYIYYIDNNNNQAQDYIAAGNTGGALAHLWFYWSPGQGMKFSQENPANNDRIMFASWWGGTQLNVNYGGTIINGDRITTNSINANKIVAGSITADKMAANSIYASAIVAGTLGAREIAGNSITGDKIAANTITAGNIQAGAITADKISIGSGSGARLTLQNNLIMGWYNDSQPSFRLGTW